MMRRLATTRVTSSLLELKPQLERLAFEVHRMLERDANFPKDSVYTVIDRVKKPERLIEKIRALNDRGEHIDHRNYREYITDLLGVRIVCLRLADLEILKRHLAQLVELNKLILLEGPVAKQTFITRPGQADPADGEADFQYSGYSSIHYVVKLGPAIAPSSDLIDLRFELQLRTIFEEAWGEIDHKYRYELTRRGAIVPKHVDTGFRDLALYLLAAARHADHLCEDVVEIIPGFRFKIGGGFSLTRKKRQEKRSNDFLQLHELDDVIYEAVGVRISEEGVQNCLRLLEKHSNVVKRAYTVANLQMDLDGAIVSRFRGIYREVFGGEPFANDSPSLRAKEVPLLIDYLLQEELVEPSASEARLRRMLRGLLEKGD